MATKYINTPSPEILMNSMRAMGYSFETAVADIIDNSISADAKNVFIQIPINDDEYYLSILDDGHGMNDKELFNAMTYGSKMKYNSKKDLGRFGLGLKSASLSQCRVLTVVSKKNDKIISYRWDLDHVIKEKEWSCLKLSKKEIDVLPTINDLKDLQHGTLVIWQNFDVIAKKSQNKIYDYLSQKIEKTEYHLKLIFHKFLEKKLNIYINNDKITPYDPFLTRHNKSNSANPASIHKHITVIKHELPHQDDLSNEDIDLLGGIESLKNKQGFYVYRNDRLIVYGTWFGLAASQINKELFKYGRIEVNIDNSVDDSWDIDIKKQNAVIPDHIIKLMKSYVEQVCNISTKKITKKCKTSEYQDKENLWYKVLNHNSKESFHINHECSFIKNIIEKLDDNTKKDIYNMLDIISAHLPYNDIYSTVCSKNYESDLDNDTINSIVLIGVENIKQIQKITKEKYDIIIERFENVQPYNNKIIISKIKERLLNERL